METLTLEKAKEINSTMVTEDHLILHAANVSAAMGAMAEHFGEDKEHWEAVGWLHDYDYEKYPDEHLTMITRNIRMSIWHTQKNRSANSAFRKRTSGQFFHMDIAYVQMWNRFPTWRSPSSQSMS